MSAEQPSEVSSKVRQYMHIVFVCDVTDPLTGQRHEIYKQTKGARARGANNATRGGKQGDSSEDSIEECRQSLQESLAASNFVDKETITEIMKCKMDGDHTVEEWIKQALDASIVEISKFLPSFSGLQLDLEIDALTKITTEIICFLPIFANMLLLPEAFA